MLLGKIQDEKTRTQIYSDEVRWTQMNSDVPSENKNSKAAKLLHAARKLSEEPWTHIVSLPDLPTEWTSKVPLMTKAAVFQMGQHVYIYIYTYTNGNNNNDNSNDAIKIPLYTI